MLRNAPRDFPKIVNFSVFSISIISIIVLFIMLSYLYPVNRNAAPIQVKIPRGMSAQAIANQLAREDLIRQVYA